MSTTPVGTKSMSLVCPSCRSRIVTRVHHKANKKTHIAALLLCISIILCPCFWAPYCIKSCQSMDHYCPNCNVYLGTYS